MKKITAILTAAALMPFSSVFAARADKGEAVTLIVEMSGDTVLEAQRSALTDMTLFGAADAEIALERKIKSRQAQVYADIEEKVDSAAERGFSYTHVFNGFSIEAYESDIEKIKALPEVENVYISQEYELYDNAYAEGEGMYLDSGCEMMHTDYMHENGISGEGMVIAVIDNGFDVGHENFSGQIANPRLSKADIGNIISSESLSINESGGDVTVNRVYRSEKIPYAYNYDNKNSDTFDASESHGTHVAGIAAGNNGTDPQGGKFTGTAPQAQLLLMACPVLSDDAVIAGIDDAVKLGADVINASFGLDYAEKNEPMSKSVNAAVNAGVVFSAAAGNAARGYNGGSVNAENIDYSAAGTPNGFSASTSVASADNINVWTTYYTMTVDSEEIKFSDENGSVSFGDRFSGGEYEYVYVGTGSTQAEFKDAGAEGKIALIDRGNGISFARRITNAKAAGAIGAVFINYEEALNIHIAPVSLQDMPTAAVTLSDGEKMKNAADKTLTASPELSNGILSGGSIKMSSFSSWGTDSSLELKPEITAPGGKIYSSVNNDKYENMSGTSMAAPHLTGATALLKQHIKNNPGIYGEPQGKDMAMLIENLFMSSADVLMQDSENGIAYSPRLQGAGAVNLEKAANTPVTLIGGVYGEGENVYEKSKISLGEIDSNELVLTFKARNLTDAPVTYDKLSMTVITDSADENGIVGNIRTLTFTADLPERVTVPANGEEEITVNVTLDQDELIENTETFINGFFVDGFVFMGTEDDSLPEISIPFTGFYGDWSSAPALDKPMYDGGVIEDGTCMGSHAYRQSDGSYAKEYETYILGKNLYADENAEDYDEYCSEAFAGISPNGDGEFDNPIGIITPLRQLGTTDFSVYDSEGRLIAMQTDISSETGEAYYARKFAQSHLDFDDNVINALDDGDYIFKAESGFYGQKEYSRNESVEMKFYVDRQKPVITKYEIRAEDGRTYLDIAAEDNRYLMGFIISGEKDGKSFREVYPIKGTETAEHSFDITGVDLDTLSAEAVDYALNSAERTASGLEIKLRDAAGSSFLFTVNNAAGGDIDAVVTAALYRDGVLAGIQSRNLTIKDGVSYESFNISNTGYDMIKLFVWSSMDDMKPLYDVFEF
ncbi:MAG: S8 family serine peptidase [Candidatus Ornithomonoglobus sp.]